MKLARIVLIPRIDCYEKYFPISVKKISNFLLRKDEDHMLRSDHTKLRKV